MCLLELFKDIFRIKLCSRKFRPLAVALPSEILIMEMCEICVSSKSMQIHLINEGNVDRRFFSSYSSEEMPVVCIPVLLKVSVSDTEDT